jgi:hypothetical protein
MKTKTLTNEAKIHLATKVDCYELLYAGLFAGFCKKGESFISIEDYNPNAIDSAYCMKYLSGVLWNLSSSVVEDIRKEYGLGTITHYHRLSKLIESICNKTGFKGEVWK